MIHIIYNDKFWNFNFDLSFSFESNYDFIIDYFLNIVHAINEFIYERTWFRVIYDDVDIGTFYDSPSKFFVEIEDFERGIFKMDDMGSFYANNVSPEKWLYWRYILSNDTLALQEDNLKLRLGYMWYEDFATHFYTDLIRLQESAVRLGYFDEERGKEVAHTLFDFMEWSVNQTLFRANILDLVDDKTLSQQLEVYAHDVYYINASLSASLSDLNIEYVVDPVLNDELSYEDKFFLDTVIDNPGEWYKYLGEHYLAARWHSNSIRLTVQEYLLKNNFAEKLSEELFVEKNYDVGSFNLEDYEYEIDSTYKSGFWGIVDRMGEKLGSYFFIRNDEFDEENPYANCEVVFDPYLIPLDIEYYDYDELLRNWDFYKFYDFYDIFDSLPETKVRQIWAGDYVNPGFFDYLSAHSFFKGIIYYCYDNLYLNYVWEPLESLNCFLSTNYEIFNYFDSLSYVDFTFSFVEFLDGILNSIWVYRFDVDFPVKGLSDKRPSLLEIGYLPDRQTSLYEYSHYYLSRGMVLRREHDFLTELQGSNIYGMKFNRHQIIGEYFSYLPHENVFEGDAFVAYYMGDMHLQNLREPMVTIFDAVIESLLFIFNKFDVYILGTNGRATFVLIEFCETVGQIYEWFFPISDGIIWNDASLMYRPNVGDKEYQSTEAMHTSDHYTRWENESWGEWGGRSSLDPLNMYHSAGIGFLRKAYEPHMPGWGLMDEEVKSPLDIYIRYFFSSDVWMSTRFGENVAEAFFLILHELLFHLETWVYNTFMDVGFFDNDTYLLLSDLLVGWEWYLPALAFLLIFWNVCSYIKIVYLDFLELILIHNLNSDPDKRWNFKTLSDYYRKQYDQSKRTYGPDVYEYYRYGFHPENDGANLQTDAIRFFKDKRYSIYSTSPMYYANKMDWENYWEEKLARELKGLMGKERDELKVKLLSQKDSESVEREIYFRIGDPFGQKPFSTSKLRGRIARSLPYDSIFVRYMATKTFYNIQTWAIALFFIKVMLKSLFIVIWDDYIFYYFNRLSRALAASARRDAAEKFTTSTDRMKKNVQDDSPKSNIDPQFSESTKKVLGLTWDFWVYFYKFGYVWRNLFNDVLVVLWRTFFVFCRMPLFQRIEYIIFEKFPFYFFFKPRFKTIREEAWEAALRGYPEVWDTLESTNFQITGRFEGDFLISYYKGGPKISYTEWLYLVFSQFFELLNVRLRYAPCQSGVIFRPSDTPKHLYNFAKSSSPLNLLEYKRVEILGNFFLSVVDTRVRSNLYFWLKDKYDLDDVKKEQHFSVMVLDSLLDSIYKPEFLFYLEAFFAFKFFKKPFKRFANINKDSVDEDNPFFLYAFNEDEFVKKMRYNAVLRHVDSRDKMSSINWKYDKNMDSFIESLSQKREDLKTRLRSGDLTVDELLRYVNQNFFEMESPEFNTSRHIYTEDICTLHKAYAIYAAEYNLELARLMQTWLDENIIEDEASRSVLEEKLGAIKEFDFFSYEHLEKKKKVKVGQKGADEEANVKADEEDNEKADVDTNGETVAGSKTANEEEVEEEEEAEDAEVVTENLDYAKKLEKILETNFEQEYIMMLKKDLKADNTEVVSAVGDEVSVESSTLNGSAAVSEIEEDVGFKALQSLEMLYYSDYLYKKARREHGVGSSLNLPYIEFKNPFLMQDHRYVDSLSWMPLSWVWLRLAEMYMMLAWFRFLMVFVYFFNITSFYPGLYQYFGKYYSLPKPFTYQQDAPKQFYAMNAVPKRNTLKETQWSSHVDVTTMFNSDILVWSDFWFLNWNYYAECFAWSDFWNPSFQAEEDLDDFAMNWEYSWLYEFDEGSHDETIEQIESFSSIGWEATPRQEVIIDRDFVVYPDSLVGADYADNSQNMSRLAHPATAPFNFSEVDGFYDLVSYIRTRFFGNSLLYNRWMAFDPQAWEFGMTDDSEAVFYEVGFFDYVVEDLTEVSMGHEKSYTNDFGAYAHRDDFDSDFQQVVNAGLEMSDYHEEDVVFDNEENEGFRSMHIHGWGSRGQFSLANAIEEFDSGDTMTEYEEQLYRWYKYNIDRFNLPTSDVEITRWRELNKGKITDKTSNPSFGRGDRAPDAGAEDTRMFPYSVMPFPVRDWSFMLVMEPAFNKKALSTFLTYDKYIKYLEKKRAFNLYATETVLLKEKYARYKDYLIKKDLRSGRSSRFEK